MPKVDECSVCGLHSKSARGICDKCDHVRYHYPAIYEWVVRVLESRLNKANDDHTRLYEHRYYDE